MKMSDNNTCFFRVSSFFILLLLFLIPQTTRGQEFYFITNCEITEDAYAYAEVQTDLDVSKNNVPLFSEDHNELKEGLHEISPLTWGTGNAIWQSEYLPYGMCYGKAYSSCWWNENVFTIDCYTLAGAKGGIYKINDEEWIFASSLSQASAYMMPEPNIRIKSDIYSEGMPVYFKIENLPVTTYANNNFNTPLYSLPCVWEVEGPTWANFTNWNLAGAHTDYVMTQIGNNIHFGTGAFGVSSVSDISTYYHTSELGFYYSNEVDVRALSTNEYSTQPFGQEIPMKDRWEFFGITDYHACGYAAMAMIVDYWAEKYNDLNQPSQDAYYLAFDKCRDVVEPGITTGEICKVLDRYFKNENNCRSGGSVPLGTLQLEPKMYTIKSSIAPVILTNLGIDEIGNFVPNAGHAIVLDGMYSCSTSPAGGSKEYWFAVRDTWISNKNIVSEYWLGGENYTNFNLDEMNWWHLNLDKTVYFAQFYVPSMDYRFSPFIIIKVIETPDISVARDMSFEMDLEQYEDQDSFDFNSPDGAIEIVYEEPDENGKLHISAPANSWAEVTFPTFVTPQAKISFDYTLSPSSTLRVYINTHQIGMFQGATLSPFYSMSSTQSMSHAKLTVDLASLDLGNSYVDLIFHISGPEDSELFLDNLIVKNSENVLGLYDLNNDGEINFIDFAALANEWYETGDMVESDFNNDHCVDFKDLYLFRSYWLY